MGTETTSPVGAPGSETAPDAIGKVVDNCIQCAFHHWEYDSTGQCVKTGWGERGPRGARLFKFPTAEKFGLIWAFNGEAAWWNLPDCQYPDDQLATDVRYDVPTLYVAKLKTIVTLHLGTTLDRVVDVAAAATAAIVTWEPGVQNY